MSRILLVAVAALSFGTSSAMAQISAGGQFTVAIPMGDFYERLDGALGFGASAHGLYLIPRTPVGVGVELGFLTYGQETLRERFGGGATGRVDIHVVTTNNIATGHFLVRLQPHSGTFRPYADGLIGVNYLFTESRIEDVRGNRPEIAASTNFDDVTFSFGGGAGFQALLMDRVGETGRAGQLLLDVRLRYLFGREAEYLKRGSIRELDGGQIVYDVERSRTDLLLPQVGLTFRF